MSFLPLFPLKLVVFPHESLNLHIFEPRYKELINECLENQETFGIPVYLDNQLEGYGTEVHITQLSNRYDDGRMDIKVKGLRVFRIETFKPQLEGRLYAGGEVAFIQSEGLSEEVNPVLLGLVDQFYTLLKINIDYYKPFYQPFSFRIAHKIGISLNDEYQLLTTPLEADRQQILIAHLERILPVIAEVERTKDLIALNGHFKEFDPLSF